MSSITLQHVTPTTAALLHWWFKPKESAPTSRFRFHERQRHAILNTISVHEALPRTAPRPARRVHPVRLTCGVDQIQVTLALLIWQLLNHVDAQAARVVDPRFTSHFLLVANLVCVRSRLFDVLCGKASMGGYGVRNFETSDLVRLAPMLIPEARREEVLRFVRDHTGSGTRCLRQAQGDGIIAITDGRVEALECLARLSPDAMVFDDETRPPFSARHEDEATSLSWRRHLRRVASSRHGCGVQVVFMNSGLSPDAPQTTAPC